MVLDLLRFTYFPLWAKGPGPALALEHSGLRWRGEWPAEWALLKSNTAWSKLPLLEVPTGSDGSPLAIGHELAILSWIARSVPSMRGSPRDIAASDQLMCECEDIYAKLTKYQPTTRIPNKVPSAELAAFWKASDRTLHNREQGLHCNLANLDAFAANYPDALYTQTGTSVGECKLFSTLHALVLIEPQVLRTHARLEAFYEGFAAHEATKSILGTGGNMPGVFEQYFVRGEGQD